MTNPALLQGGEDMAQCVDCGRYLSEYECPYCIPCEKEMSERCWICGMPTSSAGCGCNAIVLGPQPFQLPDKDTTIAALKAELAIAKDAMNGTCACDFEGEECVGECSYHESITKERDALLEEVEAYKIAYEEEQFKVKEIADRAESSEAEVERQTIIANGCSLRVAHLEAEVVEANKLLADTQYQALQIAGERDALREKVEKLEKEINLLYDDHYR